MNSKAKIPDRTLGGTFHYDEQGNFVEHIPPSKPRDAKPAPEEAAAAKPAKKGKE